MSDKYVDLLKKKRWGSGRLKEEWGDEGAKERSPASRITQQLSF